MDCCPLSNKPLLNPCIASDGHSYEHDDLVRYLSQSPSPISPVTGEVLDRRVVIPNLTLKAIIDQNSKPSLVVKEGSVRMIQGRISCNPQALNDMHAQYGWIPSALHVRPNPECIQRKVDYFQQIQESYHSIRDYILHEIFQLPVRRLHSNRWQVEFTPLRQMHRLAPNPFPYQLPNPATKHFVFWYITTDDTIWSDDQINTTLSHETRRLNWEAENPPQDIDFAWYVNPKMSLPMSITGVHHVQVFIHPVY